MNKETKLEKLRKKVFNGLACHSGVIIVDRKEGIKVESCLKCPYCERDECEMDLMIDTTDLIIAQEERIFSLEQLVLEAMKNEWEPLEK